MKFGGNGNGDSEEWFDDEDDMSCILFNEMSEKQITKALKTSSEFYAFIRLAQKGGIFKTISRKEAEGLVKIILRWRKKPGANIFAQYDPSGIIYFGFNRDQEEQEEQGERRWDF